MATIETVNIADVYPLVDEYGNDMARRDYSKKVNQDYVHQLARSMAQKGIPDEMVTLVRDGGIYRIKAGNSRVMAMRELGTKTFPAIVEDDNDVQEVLSTVIRTNTKKKYEPEEESCFVRQLALFATDEFVSEVTGLETKDVAKIRKAAEVVDDCADDMSLLRLITIGEFADDPKAVEELTNCSEREYPMIASRIKDRKAKEKSASALAKALEERGVPVVKEAPSMRLISNINKAEQIPENLPVGSVAMAHSVPGFFMLLAPAKNNAQESSKPEEDAKRAEVEAITALYKEGTKRRREWLAEQFTVQSLLPNLSRLVEESVGRFGPAVREFMEATETTYLRVGYYEIIAQFEEYNGRHDMSILDWGGKPAPYRCRDYMKLIDTMKADGYEPSEDEWDIYHKAEEYLEAAQ